MTPTTDASTASAKDQVRIDRRRGRPPGLGPAVGVCLASAGSIVLWEGLVSLARWATHTLL